MSISVYKVEKMIEGLQETADDAKRTEKMLAAENSLRSHPFTAGFWVGLEAAILRIKYELLGEEGL